MAWSRAALVVVRHQVRVERRLGQPLARLHQRGPRSPTSPPRRSGPTMLSVKSKAVMEKMLVPWCSSAGSRCGGRMRRAFSVGNSKNPLMASRIAVAGQLRQIPSSRSTPAITRTAVSSSSSLCAAETEMRSRDLCLGTAGIGDRLQEEAAVLDLLRDREDLGVVVDQHRHDLRGGLADVDALLGEAAAQVGHVAPELRAQLGLVLHDAQAGQQAGRQRRGPGCRRRSASGRRR